MTMPFFGPSLAGRSNNTTGTLALTQWAAICAPITPAPSTATFLTMKLLTVFLSGWCLHYQRIHSAMHGELNRAPFYCTVASLRGRKTVRADPRLRTDEKAIRAQSRILCKSNPDPVLFFPITVFLLRMVFIRNKNTVGARSAQIRSWNASMFI